MRILLAGTRSFGRAALSGLHDTHPDVLVAAVVAPPNDPAAGFAQDKRIPLYHEVTPEIVEQHRVDLIVCAHSHAFIGSKSRRAATHGAIGYHPSLLPRHRGKDAVRWTIKMGDPIAGGSVYWFTNHVDGGPIAAQQFVHVQPGWDHHDLWQVLFPVGVRLLRQVVGEVARGRFVQVDQNEAVATWEPSWERPPVHRPELVELGDGVKKHPVIQKEVDDLAARRHTCTAGLIGSAYSCRACGLRQHPSQFDWAPGGWVPSARLD